MEEIMLVGYEVIAEVIPAIFTMTIYAFINKKKGAEESGGHILCVAAFVVYVLGVLHFTGAGTLFEADFYGIKFRDYQINFIPFSDKNIDYAAYALNVVLFIPLGFFLPFIWRNYKSMKKTVAFGIVFSLLIEVSQLLNNRRTDVDDLLLNTVGTFLGFLLFRTCRDTRSLPDSESNKTEAIIYVLVMFLGRFFLFNEIGAAKLLFGF